MLIFCYKKNIASPCSTIQIIKILLHRPAALKQYLQYSGVTMQNYSRMQCNIFALHAHEKNCTVTPRFNNASPYARKRSATLKIAKKASLLTTMDVWSRFSTSMLHRGAFMACFIKFMSDVTKKWNIFEIYSRMLFIFTVSIFFLLLLFLSVMEMRGDILP